MKILAFILAAFVVGACSVPPQFNFSYTGYHILNISGENVHKDLNVKRIMLDSLMIRYGLSPTDSVVEFSWLSDKGNLSDTVPVSFGEMTYKYIITCKNGDTVKVFETDRFHFPKNLYPIVKIPSKQGWETIYTKAWDLTWQRIRTSAVLPERFAYNDYPDNSFTYVWDAAFCNLFQRYAEAHGGHPGILTYDGFYEASQKYDNGYIPRRVNINDLQTHPKEVIPSERGTNPPLYGWAEWNHMLATGDTSRLRKVLPLLCHNYEFMEKEMQVKPGYYDWGGDGSGWDNIDWGKQGKKLAYWVELPALQALAAKYIVKIANLLKEEGIVRKYKVEIAKKKLQMEPYWNESEGWYCGLTKDGEFTRKTLQGIWPLMAGIVDSSRVVKIVKNLEDQSVFNTSPIPLPTLAKDELGYNPKGEYWLGSVWINMSLVTIRSLRENGYPELASSLAKRTLDGIYAVYTDWEKQPNTLWECYSPEFIAPASHKTRFPDQLGTVRSEFGGWTGCLINLLVEEALGIHVDALNNRIVLNLQYNEDFEIENLKFGNTTVKISLRKEPKSLKIKMIADEDMSLVLDGKEYSITANNEFNYEFY